MDSQAHTQPNNKSATSWRLGGVVHCHALLKEGMGARMQHQATLKKGMGGAVHSSASLKGGMGSAASAVVR